MGKGTLLSQQKARFQNLDLMRGLLILYMIVAHMSLTYGLFSFNSVERNPFFVWMSFFMTYFYISSGYLFSCKKGTKEYIINKIDKLIIPYLFWTAVSLVVFYTYEYITIGEISWKSPFKPIFVTGAVASDTPLWFLFSLFAVTIIYYIVSKYTRYIHVFIILCFLFAFLVHNKTQILGWGNISLGLVYFHLGHMFRSISEKKYVAHWVTLVVALIVYISIGVLYSQDMAFVTLYVRQGSFVCNLIWSVSACYVLWYISRYVKCIRPINWIGLNSLTIYASHRIILNWIYDPTIRFVYDEIPYYEYITIGGGVILFTSIVMFYTLKRFCPRVLGIKNKKLV